MAVAQGLVVDWDSWWIFSALRQNIKNPSTTSFAQSPCAASGHDADGRGGLSFYDKVFYQLPRCPVSTHKPGWRMWASTVHHAGRHCSESVATRHSWLGHSSLAALIEVLVRRMITARASEHFIRVDLHAPDVDVHIAIRIKHPHYTVNRRIAVVSRPRAYTHGTAACSSNLLSRVSGCTRLLPAAAYGISGERHIVLPTFGESKPS